MDQPPNRPPDDPKRPTPPPGATPPPPPGSAGRPPQPPPGPPPGYGRPAHPQRPARPGPGWPAPVQVINRPAGFFRSVGAFITGLAVLGFVFGLGIIAGLVILIGVGFAGMSSMDQFVLEQVYREGSRQKIAIIPVEGVIDGRRAAFIRACVENTLQDASVAAVVLRIDSPGGGVTASDQIWHQIGRLQSAGLPVVASYGSVAASGGYYVSCASDYIMAEETCITGSIGVMAQIMTFENLLDKVGIEPVTLVATDSPNKDLANDILHSWTEEDRQEVQEMLDAAYEIFRTRVANGRSAVITDPNRLDTLADGSIYTAKQAMNAGLVDGVGYLDDAIVQAERIAGLPTGRATVVVTIEPAPLFAGLPRLEGNAPKRSADMLDADRLRSFVNELGSVRLMYLMH